MSDDTPGPANGLPLEPVVPSAGSRRGALWGVLAVIALVTGGVVVASRGDSAPERLPVALGPAALSEGSGAASGDMRMAWVHYVAGEGLPAMGGEATAYRLDGAIDEAQVRALASAMGMSEDPTRDGELWRVESGGDVLEVFAGGGGSWWYSANYAQISSAVGSSGTEECAPDGTCTISESCTPEPCTAPAPQPPTNPNLPSEEQARQIALDLLGSTGVDVGNATVTVDGPYEAWYVSLEQRVDGVAVSGAGSSVGVGANGTILNASGTLGTPVALGGYPLLDTRAAIDRLNDQQGHYVADDDAFIEPAVEPGTEPDAMSSETCRNEAGGGTVCESSSEPVPSPAPLEITLVDAEPVLLLFPATDASGASYLVPGYRMTDADGGTVDVVAVDDDSLLPTQGAARDLVDPSEPVDYGPVVLPADATPDLGVGYYVDVDVECGAFELGGEIWRHDSGDLAGWSLPHEGGTFTLDAPDHGTFVGDYEGQKTATFVTGTDEQGCTPAARG